MKRQSFSHRGFTLIELMMTVAILGVLVALAAPQMGSTIRANELRGQLSKFRSAVAFARNQATTLRTQVFMCSSVDEMSCAGNMDWSAGFIVFVDVDGNRILDDNDCMPASGCLLRSVSGLEGGIEIDAAVDSLGFDELGNLAGANTACFSLSHPDDANLTRTARFVASGSHTVTQGGMPCP